MSSDEKRSVRRSILKSLNTSVGQKFIMAVSGLALVGFIIMHLLGNLSLYQSSGEAFNTYAATLVSFGPLMEAAEIGLLLLFLVHIVTALRVTAKNKMARPERYKMSRSKGGPSKKNLVSTGMIISGLVLIVFVILHVKQFHFGPGISDGYTTNVKAFPEHEVRDLHRLVVETFKQPLNVLFYVAVMIFLGAHIRHGFWSAFQSSGLFVSRYSREIYCLGLLMGLVLAGGFLFIPLWIFFDLGAVLGALL